VFQVAPSDLWTNKKEQNEMQFPFLIFDSTFEGQHIYRYILY
jgi:hypothetical protein